MKLQELIKKKILTLCFGAHAIKSSQFSKTYNIQQISKIDLLYGYQEKQLLIGEK